VQGLNEFRKVNHLKRIEVAKINERLEREAEGEEKPSFDTVYADKLEFDLVKRRRAGPFIILFSLSF
jgi:hypothetical protein